MRDDGWARLLAALAALALLAVLLGGLLLQSGLASRLVDAALAQPTWTPAPALPWMAVDYTPLAFPTFAAPGDFTLFPPTPTRVPTGAIYVAP